MSARDEIEAALTEAQARLDAKRTGRSIDAARPAGFEQRAIDHARGVMARHRPYGIYTECGHDYDRCDQDDHFEIDEVGRTCRDGLLYVACAECCCWGDEQSEECADRHEHTKEHDCPEITSLHTLWVTP